jgi:chemotaxis protein MotA
MAKYPPAFGMIGTVVGLIALMASIGGNIDMSSIGTYMAVALTTTLYGLALSNFIFKPIADNMEMGSSRSLRARQMILESMILVKHRASLLVIQDTLNSFLPITENIDIMSTHAKEANDAA